MKAVQLIDSERINAIGGLGDSDIRRILENFIGDLPGYVSALENLKLQGNGPEIILTLHKLKGAALTCGFSAVAQASALWLGSSDPFNDQSQLDLQATIDATIREWRALDG